MNIYERFVLMSKLLMIRKHIYSSEETKNPATISKEYIFD